MRTPLLVLAAGSVLACSAPAPRAPTIEVLWPPPQQIVGDTTDFLLRFPASSSAMEVLARGTVRCQDPEPVTLVDSITADGKEYRRVKLAGCLAKAVTPLDSSNQIFFSLGDGTETSVSAVVQRVPESRSIPTCRQTGIDWPNDWPMTRGSTCNVTDVPAEFQLGMSCDFPEAPTFVGIDGVEVRQSRAGRVLAIPVQPHSVVSRALAWGGVDEAGNHMEPWFLPIPPPKAELVKDPQFSTTDTNDGPWVIEQSPAAPRLLFRKRECMSCRSPLSLGGFQWTGFVEVYQRITVPPTAPSSVNVTLHVTYSPEPGSSLRCAVTDDATGAELTMISGPIAVTPGQVLRVGCRLESTMRSNASATWSTASLWWDC